MNLRYVALLPLAALLATGCQHNSSVGPALFATGIVAGAMIATDYERAERDRERDRDDGSVVQRVYVVNRTGGSALPAAEPASPALPVPPPFDAKAARGALAGVDLAKCREIGAPRGYGHAKVTLNPPGDVSKVVIDEPVGMPAEAVKCIGEALGRATVPEFSGRLVTVGTTWFVP